VKAIARRSRFFVVVISIVVLILAYVSAQGQNATGDGAALYKAECAICHGRDGAGKTPTGQKCNLRNLHSAEVQKQSDSDLSRALAQDKGKMPAFGKTIGEDQTQLLVAHIRESARNSRLEKWPWQPITRG
jgi:mono/diheme cytochrome c family protein